MTHTSQIRGRAGRAVAAMAAAAALVAVAAPHPAGADQLANARARAIALNAQIQSLGYQEDALSEKYDAEQAVLAQARAHLAVASRDLARANTAQARTMALLRQDAIQAYVGQGPQADLASSIPANNVNEALLGQQLAQTFAAQQTDALDSYRLAAANASAARARLTAARNADAHELAQLNADRDRVAASQQKLIALEAQVKGQIATILAQIRHQQLLAAERAAAERLARERAAAAAAAAEARARAAALAQAQAAALAREQAQAAAQAQRAAQIRTAAALEEPGATTTTTIPGVYTPPPVSQVPGVSPAASIALQAALSRVGDPYVWGASGPDAFDCSGLVMWAYAQAGVSLPHYSGAQYGITIHIPISDLEPGDLVFPADPGQHVAMYAGNGMIVQAPYTGADVQVVPLTSFFVLASRVG